ncbi:hypothetical protein [Pseudenhygromyxa sp. WMMC2535]|nr:hypothetical protein [Pseudenhygromyxa sp. WMMC2535]
MVADTQAGIEQDHGVGEGIEHAAAKAGRSRTAEVAGCSDMFTP